MRAPTCELIDAGTIAELLDVQQRTVYHWTFRGELPPATEEVDGRPHWRADDVRAWATATGRLTEDGPVRLRAPKGPVTDEERRCLACNARYSVPSTSQARSCSHSCAMVLSQRTNPRKPPPYRKASR